MALFFGATTSSPELGSKSIGFTGVFAAVRDLLPRGRCWALCLPDFISQSCKRQQAQTHQLIVVTSNCSFILAIRQVDIDPQSIGFSAHPLPSECHAHSGRSASVLRTMVLHPHSGCIDEAISIDDTLPSSQRLLNHLLNTTGQPGIPGKQTNRANRATGQTGSTGQPGAPHTGD